MKKEPTIFCFSEDNEQALKRFLEQLSMQGFRIVSLRDAIRQEEQMGTGESTCAMIVRSCNESFLSCLPAMCKKENIHIAVFLQEMISDKCISCLHAEERTPVFCDMSLLYRYSSAYLRQRLYLQVMYADVPVDSRALAFLRESRTRILLTCGMLHVAGYSTMRVTQASLQQQAKGPLSLELPISKPILTCCQDAPFLAIRQDEFYGKWGRSYCSADGVYTLTSDLSEKYTWIQKEALPSVERLTDALRKGMYPLVRLGEQKQTFLIYARQDSTASFLAYASPFPCVWKSFCLVESLLRKNLTSCEYLMPLPGSPGDDAQILRNAFHAPEAPQAFLHDFYTVDRRDDTAVKSLGAFLQERIFICRLLLREANQKSLYLPDAESHSMLIERHVQPVLQIMENGLNPFSGSSRLLMADSFAKILLSEERCMDAYIEELDRQSRYAEWERLFRKKGVKT